MSSPASFLDIATYRENETRASERMGISAIRAFGPITFANLGIPTRVDAEAALHRYVDSMGVAKADSYWKPRFRMSEHEIEQIRAGSALVEELTAEWFGRRIRPLIDASRAIEMYRLVNTLSQVAGRKLTILEIGPGGGYLSLFLARQGHRCLVVDNTEGFYLWQNRLYRSAFGDRFIDTAERDWAPGAFSDPQGDVVHVPWWHFARLGEVDELPKVDVVVAEDVLSEMQALAIQFTAGISARLLQHGNPGLMAFTSPGLQYMFDVKQVHSELCRFGFRNVRAQEFWLYAAPGTALTAFGEGDKIRINVPPPLADVSPFDPFPASGPGSETRDLRDAIELPPEMVSQDFGFLQVTGVDHPFGPRRTGGPVLG